VCQRCSGVHNEREAWNACQLHNDPSTRLPVVRKRLENVSFAPRTRTAVVKWVSSQPRVSLRQRREEKALNAQRFRAWEAAAAAPGARADVRVGRLREEGTAVQRQNACVF